MNWLHTLTGRAPLVKLPTGTARVHINEDEPEDAEREKKLAESARRRPAQLKAKRSYYQRNKTNKEFLAKHREAADRWREKNPEHYRKLQNAANRAYYERIKDTPEYKARKRSNGLKYRKTRAADPEYRAKKRASNRAYIVRMRVEDPEKYAAYLARQAEWKRNKRAKNAQP